MANVPLRICVCFLGTYCFLHVTPTVQTPGGLAFSCRKQVPGRSQLSSASRVRELSELQRNICQSCLRLFLRDPSAPCAKVPEPAYIARQIGSRLQLEQVLDGALAQLCQARTPSRSRLSLPLQAANQCWKQLAGRPTEVQLTSTLKDEDQQGGSYQILHDLTRPGYD